jgi:hypothetical protein
MNSSKPLFWPLAHLGYSAIVASVAAEAPTPLAGSLAGAVLIAPVAAVHCSLALSRLALRYGFPRRSAAALGALIGVLGGAAEGALVGSVSVTSGKQAGVGLAVTIAATSEIVESRL